MFQIFFKGEKLEFILFFLHSKSLLGLGRTSKQADCLHLRGIFFSEQFTIAELSIIANTQRANFFLKSTKSMITLKTMKRLKMYPTFLHPLIAYDNLEKIP